MVLLSLFVNHQNHDEQNNSEYYARDKYDSPLQSGPSTSKKGKKGDIQGSFA
jgi:hypothetical protein